MTEDLQNNRIQNECLPSYRLRKNVRYLEKGNSAYLILSYPLKVIILDPIWKRVMIVLGRQEFVPFRELVSLVNDLKPERIEIFLNELIRKGFLESQGYMPPEEYPFVTVIIPVRNRPKAIADCLESLTRLVYPREKMEVIVIDDASDDNTPEIVTRYPVQIIRLDRHSQASYCRNLATRKASGEILAFLDSDCLSGPHWLMEIIPIFNDPANGAAGGLVDSFYNENGLDRYEKVKSSLNMGKRPKNSMEGDLFLYVPTCNMLVRKEVFLDIGGFKEDLFIGEDVDFCWRMQDRGFHLEYRPVGRIFHKHRNRIKDFCSRRFDYGTSEPMLQQSHRRRVKNMVLPVPSAMFWSFVLIAFMTINLWMIGMSVIILLAESLFKWAAIKKKAVPVAFRDLLNARFRDYLSLPYHLCVFFSRYYLVWSLPLLLLWPFGAIIIIFAHIITAIWEYLMTKPFLSFPYFFVLFTLDQLSYQLGVWCGCFKRLYFGPVNPHILRRPPR